METHPVPITAAEVASPSDYRPPTQAEQVANDFVWSYSNATTRMNYIQGLKHWFRFCQMIGIDPLTGLDGNGVRRADVEKFLRYAEDVRGLARRTVAGSYSAIKGFFRRARIDGIIDKDPCEFVKAPVVERKTSTNDLTWRQVTRVMKLAEKRSKRDHALLCLLAHNGLRVSELVGIDVEDLGWNRASRTVTVQRKGGKSQTLSLSSTVSWAIDQHLDGRTTGALFQSKRSPGKRMTRADVQGLVKRYARWAGIPQRISPHSFRHTFITQALNAGVSPRAVQRAAGHADPRMTDYYDHGDASLEREAAQTLDNHYGEMMDD